MQQHVDGVTQRRTYRVVENGSVGDHFYGPCCGGRGTAECVATATLLDADRCRRRGHPAIPRPSAARLPQQPIFIGKRSEQPLFGMPVQEGDILRLIVRDAQPPSFGAGYAAPNPLTWKRVPIEPIVRFGKDNNFAEILIANFSW